MSAQRAPRILVVDDEPAVRHVVTRALEEAGYQVAALSEPQSVLDHIHRADDPVDLVVANSRMPGMSGPELIARVRSLRPALPILHIDDASQPPPVPAAARCPDAPETLQPRPARRAGAAAARPLTLVVALERPPQHGLPVAHVPVAARHHVRHGPAGVEHHQVRVGARPEVPLPLEPEHPGGIRGERRQHPLERLAPAEQRRERLAAWPPGSRRPSP